MGFSREQLNGIYGRTDGRCHLCGKKIARKNYGLLGNRGAWEVDHSVPRAKGGTDHGNNLYAACMSCNRSKQAGSSRSARRRNGVRRAPLSKKRKDEIRSRNAVVGGGMGLVSLVLPIAGPAKLLATVASVAVGAFLGRSIDPEEG